jgi:hypothetical protein
VLKFIKWSLFDILSSSFYQVNIESCHFIACVEIRRTSAKRKLQKEKEQSSREDAGGRSSGAGIRSSANKKGKFLSSAAVCGE